MHLNFEVQDDVTYILRFCITVHLNFEVPGDVTYILRFQPRAAQVSGTRLHHIIYFWFCMMNSSELF